MDTKKMKGSSTFIPLFTLLFQFTVSIPSMHPLCHTGESTALLKFKESFTINKYATPDPLAYPKVTSWNLGEVNNNCCSWEGVECDHNTGHVIGLDLSSSCLYGSLNSNSSLFQLVHLQKLNLAFNHFNFSQVPSRFCNLPKLTYLNLSDSLFSGQIPSELSMLSKLSSLDLSNGYGFRFLNLEIVNLRNIVQNMTNLEYLHLDSVKIASPFPHMLANFSSLKSLHLSNCGLHGEFPFEIFQLPNLQFLHMPNNPNLRGHLPDFQWSSNNLKSLWIRNTSFSGQLSASIGNFHSLEILDISYCKFSGLIPFSLGNITKLGVLDFEHNSFTGKIPSSLSNSTYLNYVALGSNKLHGSIPSLQNNLQYFSLPSNFLNGTLELHGLSQLTYLDLKDNQFTGKIPYSLANSTNLKTLRLAENQLTGQIPSWLMNLTQLSYLHMGINNLHGTIPISISRLVNIEYLLLCSNNLNGSVELDQFLKLKKLKTLDIGRNKLSLHTKTSSTNTTTLPELFDLGLNSCNLTEFPIFLQNQNDLKSLDLSFNNINGQIPEWILNISRESLLYMDLSYNMLNQSLVFLPWSNLLFLNISSNFFQGSSLPIPSSSSSILFYSVSNNSLTGELPAWICNLTSLQVLDLSNNNLSGIIPSCLSDSLYVLNLENNSFSGNIPQKWKEGSKLRLIRLGQNKLHGKVPRSLTKCTKLQSLDLGNNQLNDTFPLWLGALSDLKILILRFNHFHGTLGRCGFNSTFSKMRIIDLSSNNLSGELHSDCFASWNAMKVVESVELSYMQADTSVDMGSFVWHDNYFYSMTMTNKGVQRQYAKVVEIFSVIDLSCNKFEGKIPELIGTLRGLRSVNLSNNLLIGSIPISITNLTNIESLDLSQNMLSGTIPEKLKQLTFLEKFDVSHNHLTGHIPQGDQFDTFPNNSYDGNSGLCGSPLSKLCESLENSPSVLEHDQDSGSLFNFGWHVVAMGYGCGLVVGLLTGHLVTRKRHGWFMKNFSVIPKRRRRLRRHDGSVRSGF